MHDRSGSDLDDWIAGMRAEAQAYSIAAHEYQYGPDPEQVADLRLPTSDQPHPVVVLIHGGAFRAKHDRGNMEANAVDLTRRGYATWNIEYRRTDCGGGPETTTEDVASALRYLHTLEAPLDLDRCVVLGHSAGGYLALWSAGLPTVHRVVALAAVCDFRLIATSADTPYAGFAGGTPEEIPAAYESLDLTRRFPTGARLALLCGAADSALRIRENREFVAAARGSSEQVSYRELPGVEHFPFLDAGSDAWRAALDTIHRLLR